MSQASTTYIGRATLMALVTDVLGRTKEAAVNEGDGFPWYNCPWCTYGVYARTAPPDGPGVLGTHGRCNNPWCVANPAMPVAKAQDIVNAQALTDAAAAERTANHLAALRRIAEDREARKARDLHVMSEAVTRGTCEWCAVHHGKFIKHRTHCRRK